MIEIRKSEDRGRANHGWLDARHTFSFAGYHDPAHDRFRSLRVLNEDRVAPEMGFSMHPHRDMEILTYVVSGSLRHRDSMGNTALMKAGGVQRISAGSGIEHSEVNESTTEPVHLLQIWLFPDRKGLAPSYAERSYADAAIGTLHPVASKTGHDGSIPINQDADVFLGKLAPGDQVTHPLRAGRHAWLQLVKGSLAVNGVPLDAGDAAAVSETELLTLSASAPSDFLLFDLN